MSDEYITNVIAHLLANVEYFYFATIRHSVYQMYGDLLLGRVSTDIVAEAFGAPALTRPHTRRLAGGDSAHAGAAASGGHATSLGLTATASTGDGTEVGKSPRRRRG